DLSELESYLAEIETFDGIFVTSVIATEILLAKLCETRKNFHGKFFVLGKRSDDLLKQSGYKTFFSEQATTAKELLELIPKKVLKNKRFLFPRGNRSLRVVSEMLQNIAEVCEAVVYQTLDAETDERKLIEIKEKLANEKINVVCFFSPSAVERFLSKFEKFLQNKIKVAVVGKTTANFAEANNLRVDFVSTKPSADDFAALLGNFLRRLRN
ncbi:MAG: uroporphyrinogen-III synthase, partial [Acidobacteria bacterium]|nr:uroporphyrinogen-III synthase [Acidobacteriota bacterium]